jgi:membrane protein implicated in regulation of membrane protease activity
MPFGGIGKTLMLIGAVIFLLGGVLTLTGKIPWLGHLPGDIHIKRENFQFYFPLGTSIVLSVVLSLLLTLFFRK